MLTWLEVDLKTIEQNIAKIKKYIGPKIGLAAVIKSNAYGHGLIEVAKAAAKAKAEFLCVDNVAEAKQILNAEYLIQNTKVLILGGVESEDLPFVIRNNIRFGIYDLAFARKVEQAARKKRKKALVHIKVDTGMHRLGFNADEVAASIKKIKQKYKNIEIEGLWSHFADSGSRENIRYTMGQITKFNRIIKELEGEENNILYKHLSNSAGALVYKEARYNLVRTGIIIYGVYSSKNIKEKFHSKLKLKSALNFKTRIVSLRQLKKGERIGYGLTHRLKRKSTVAVLAVGYKDGYGRDLSNKGEVVIKGHKCKVLGRICMRMMMVDVSRVPNVKLDDEVILLGGNGHVRIEADEVAEKMGTIPYEVLSRISESVPRIYKN